jgi:hypothetical protein
MISNKRKLITITSFGLFVLSTNTFAYKQTEVAEFSFIVQSNDISLKYPNSVNRTKVSTLRATWWQPLTKWLQGAISLAYVDMSQNTYATVPAYSSTGYNLGIGLRGGIIQNNVFNLGLKFTFDYLSTSGGTSLNQRTEVSWLEYIGSADFEFLPTKPVSILAGVSYTIIDGEQKIYNTFNTIHSFSANTPEGYYAGIGIKTGDTGRIEMKWYEGTRQGFYLTFSNRF